MSDLMKSQTNTLGNQKVRKYNLKDSYKVVSWVYSCVTRIADSIAGIPVYFYTEDEAGERFEIDSQHPLSMLFSPPKEWQITSMTELIKLTVIYNELFGESFWKYQLKSGMPIEVDVINPFKLQPLFHKKDPELIVGWGEWEMGSIKNIYTLGQITQYKYPNPYNKWRGQAPLSALRLPIEQELNMGFWNAEFFRSGLRSPIAILIDKVLKGNQRKEIIEEIEKNYAGFMNGQKPLMVEGGADVKTLMTTIKDLDFIQGKQLTREEICSAFGVPPALVGIYRYANYANSEAQERLFWNNTLIPKMRYIQEVLQVHLCDDYYPEIKVDFRWENIDVLKEDETKKAEINYKNAQTVETYLTNGFTREEIAEIIGVPAIASTSSDGEGGTPPPPSLPTDEEPIIEMIEHFKYDVIDHPLYIEHKASSDALSIMNDVYNEHVLEYYTLRWERFISSFLENATRTLIKRIDKGSMHPFLSEIRWSSMWSEFSLPIVDAIYSQGVRNVLSEMESPKKSMFFTAYKVQGDITNLYEPQQVDVMNLAINDINNKTKGFSIKMVNELNRVTQGAIMAGATPNQIRKLLQQSMGNIFSSNALTVARTVTGSAYNSARFTGAGMKGGFKHTWSSSRDSVVRDTHVMEHGNETVIGTVFPVTKLLHPLDPKGKAEEIINCRCTAFVSAKWKNGKPVPVGVTAPKPIGTIITPLKSHEASIKNLPNEKSFMLDPDGKTIFEKGGGSNSITYTGDELDLLWDNDIDIMTHNHPRGTSFSEADIFFGHRVRTREMRVVGSSKSNKTYAFGRKDGTKMFNTRDTIFYKDRYKEAEWSVRQRFMDEIEAGRMSIDEATLLHSHEVMKEFIKHKDIKKIYYYKVVDNA